VERDYNYYVDEESPKQSDAESNTLDFLVNVLNLFGFLGGTVNDYEDNEIQSKIDDLTVPAELTMMVVGLYGLYFSAVGYDLSNRRKKRSLEELLVDDKMNCQVEYDRCLQLNYHQVKTGSRNQENLSEAWIQKCMNRRQECEKSRKKMVKIGSKSPEKAH